MALLVTAEALSLFLFWGYGDAPILGGDGPAYHRLAVNLLDHAAFSVSETPPYEPTLIRTPGYPFFVAMIYLLSGRSLLALRIAQFVLLALTAWWLYLLLRRFAERRVAAVAAALCATYSPLVFIANYHLTETLSALLAVLFVVALVQAIQSSTPRLLFVLLTGMIVGMAALVRPSLALLIIVLLAVVARRGIECGWQRAVVASGVAIIGFVICLAPWTLRNFAVSQQFTPFTAGVGGSGMSLFTSAQQYSGEVSYRISPAEWQQILADYDRRMANAHTAATRTPSEVAVSIQQEIILNRAYLQDGWRKLWDIGWRELLQNLPARLAYLWSTGDFSPWPAGGFHRFVQIHYAILFLLIIYGCYLKRAVLLSHWPLWIMPVYLTLVHLVFHVEPRYSFPARPFLLLYAGAALEQVITLARGARRPASIVEQPIEPSTVP